MSGFSSFKHKLQGSPFWRFWRFLKSSSNSLPNDFAVLYYETRNFSRIGISRRVIRIEILHFWNIARRAQAEGSAPSLLLIDKSENRAI
uniref:Uncharacterized protein n=1 Tax=Parascaris equorum TaxID=6256 RepID=A0A914RTF8_PAREQ